MDKDGLPMLTMDNLSFAFQDAFLNDAFLNDALMHRDVGDIIISGVDKVLNKPDFNEIAIFSQLDQKEQEGKELKLPQKYSEDGFGLKMYKRAEKAYNDRRNDKKMKLVAKMTTVKNKVTTVTQVIVAQASTCLHILFMDSS